MIGRVALLVTFKKLNQNHKAYHEVIYVTLCVIWIRYQDLVYLIKILVKMGKNTSISLGNHFEDFIREEVNSGRYGSVSEVIRSALRLLEREEKKEKELIKALEVGENSGFVENFDPKQHLKELHRKHL